MNLNTDCHNTWCPGCGNFLIEKIFRDIISELIDEGFNIDNFVVISGIGCHAKISDFLNMNSFYSLHGRTLPPATGMKLANPKLSVICFSGDGDSLGEGISHSIFSAKRNSDVSLFVHDNGNYGLTAGQFTPTSSKGFIGKSTPFGNSEEPLNPVLLMLSSGATFVARTSTFDIKQLKDVMKQAILHKGFSFVDILQHCPTFNKSLLKLKDNFCNLSEMKHNVSDFSSALEKSREAYKIYTGVFYNIEKPTFEEQEIADSKDSHSAISDYLKTKI